MSNPLYHCRPLPTTQAIINGQTIEYDACACGLLSDAKTFYGDRYNYLGVSDGIILSGTHMWKGEPHHIFVLKNKKSI